MKLTPLQLEIIAHRLEEPDCLWDVFDNTRYAGDITNTFPTFLMDVTEPQLYVACATLAEKINREFDPAEVTDLEAWLFEECVDGSTYADICQDGVGTECRDNGKIITQQYANAANRATEQLADIAKQLLYDAVRKPDAATI